MNMNTIKYKTNIKCAGCIEKVTPVLDQMLGKEGWAVNTADPDKILTAKLPADIDAAAVTEALGRVGYKAYITE